MHPSDNSHQVEGSLPHPSDEANALSVAGANQDRGMKAENASRTAELPQINTPVDPTQVAGASSTVPIIPPPLPDSSKPSSPTNIPVIDAPVLAEDEDLIEQEWVDKAKDIVERTKDDPHKQNKEISKFKADYIKKRYNKEIKSAEE